MEDQNDVEVLDLEKTVQVPPLEQSQEMTIPTEKLESVQEPVVNSSINNMNDVKPEPIEEKTPRSLPNTPIDHTEEIKKYKKHNSYQSRMIKYAVFSILSILLIIISFTSYRLLIKETSTYTENAKVSYQVCLKENNYYQDKCIGENAEYVAAITDTIRADFNYSAVYQEKEVNHYSYYLKSQIQMKTDDENEREFLNKEKKLTSLKKIDLNGNVLNIVESVEIPFKKYNDYAQNYKNDYGLINNSNLIISLVVKEGNKETEVSSITIPLTKLSYNISKKEINNEVKTYEIKTNKMVKYLLTAGMILGGLLTIISFLNILRFLWKTRTKKSSYQKKLQQILNTYDRVIITLEDKNTIINNQEVYKVKSFLELLDVRDTIDKPILYYKVNDIKTEFYVQDIHKTYKFTMKESDFEDKK